MTPEQMKSLRVGDVVHVRAKITKIGSDVAGANLLDGTGAMDLVADEIVAVEPRKPQVGDLVHLPSDPSVIYELVAIKGEVAVCWHGPTTRALSMDLNALQVWVPRREA